MASERFHRNLAERWWTLFPWGVTGVYAVRIVVGVILYVQPVLFESRVVLEETPQPRVNPSAALPLGDSLLHDVEAALDLEARWGLSARETVDILRQRISIVRSDTNGQTVITCRHANAWDARDIAEILGNTYDGWERVEAKSNTDPAFLTQLGQLDHQSMLVERYRQHVREWKEISEKDRVTELAIMVVDEGMSPEQAVALEMARLKRLWSESTGGEEMPPGEIDRLPEAVAAPLRKEIVDYRQVRDNLSTALAEQKRLTADLAGIRLPDPSQVKTIEPALIGTDPVSPRIQYWMSRTTFPGMALGALLWFAYMARWRDPVKSAKRRADKAKKDASLEY